MEKPFVDYISFVRFALMDGSAETFQKMKLSEFSSSLDANKKLQQTVKFLGTPIPSQGSKAEERVWLDIGNSFRNIVLALPVQLPDVQKMLQDDSKPEGPHLTTAQRVGNLYLQSTIIECAKIFEMSKIF